MNDILTIIILLTAALSIISCALIIYLIVLVDQLKTVLLRMHRNLFRPEVPRDGNGRTLFERR